MRTVLNAQVQINEEFLGFLQRWLKCCRLDKSISTPTSTERPSRLDIAVDICLVLAVQRGQDLSAELRVAVDHVLQLYDNSLAGLTTSGKSRFLWTFPHPSVRRHNETERRQALVNSSHEPDVQQSMFEVCIDMDEWDAGDNKALPLGVLSGNAGLTYAHVLPLVERYIVLASTVRATAMVNPANCTRIVSAALLHPVLQVRLRAILQIPSLLANLQLPCSVVESCLDSLQEGETTMSQHWSTQSASLAVTNFQTLRGFMYKLGQWILRDQEAPTLDVRICSAHSSCRLTALPLVEDRVGEDTLERRKASAYCRCHGGDCIPRLGDIPGCLCLWELVLRASLCNDGQGSQSLPSSIRVAIVHGCASLLRRQAHVGAWLQVDTGLVSQRFAKLLSKFFDLVEDPDGNVRAALAEEFSVFVDGCGGGIESAKESFNETSPANDDASSQYIEDNSTGRGELRKCRSSYLFSLLSPCSSSRGVRTCDSDDEHESFD